jgi:hypothetical protein
VPELFVLGVIVRVEVANPHWLHSGGVTTVGLRVTLGLAEPDGDTAAVRVTGPGKRLVVWIVIFDVAEVPGWTVTEVGLAVRENDGGQRDAPVCGHATFQAVRGCSSQPE